MTSSRHCTKCGAAVPATTPLGLCPQCLVRLGLAAGTPDPTRPDEQAAYTPTSSPQPLTSGLTRFGDYELIEDIGRGGMGVVYRAHQVSLDRFVALKTILFGPLATPEQIRRFRTEASAAAALQHPNIVAVHEVGVHQNQHYLVMDLVDGPNLAGLVKNRPLPAQRAAAYLKSIAEAIHFAHERGILHRDLKPSNVLVGSDDRPRVADFGLARRLGTDSSLTISGQMLGSPNYMPPEQAAVGRGKMGRAGDVYGLGAVLYHLLTARPPFQAETIPQTIDLVTSAEPLSPRALVPSIPRDLETICLKCLEKDPAKRYPTAQALVDELDRFLKGEPIQARPVGAVGKGWRWCRRKPAIAAALALSIISLLVVAVVSTVSAARTNRARQAERLEAYYSAIALADQYIQQGDIQSAKELLFGCPQELRHWEWGHLMYQCHQDVLSITAHTNLAPSNPSSQVSMVNASVSPRIVGLSFVADGSSVASHGVDGSFKVWAVEDGRLQLTLGGESQEPVVSCTPAGQGRWLVVSYTNQTMRVIEAINGRELGRLSVSTNPISHRLLSADGRTAVTVETGRVRVWDVGKGDRLCQWSLGSGPVEQAELSEDGRRLATKQRDRAIVWDLNSGAELWRLEPPLEGIAASAMAPGGQALVTFDGDNHVTLWRTNGPAVPLGVIQGAGWEQFRWAVFSPDAHWFCTGGERGTARVWETESGREHFALSGRVSSAVFSPDGRLLATLSRERAVRIWEVESGRELRVLRGHPVSVEHVCFSSDGRLVATADQNGTIKLWSARNGREVLSGDAWAHGACYSPDGERVASVSVPLDVRVWNAASGAELARFRPGIGHQTDGVEFSPDGQYLAMGGSPVTSVHLFDSRSGRLVRTFEGPTRYVFGTAFSPDGRQLAAASWDGTVRLWDVQTGALLRVLNHPGETLNMVVFSPDGQRLYVSTSYSIAAWDSRSGSLIMETDRSRLIWPWFGLTPDGERLYTADYPVGRMHAWDARTGRALDAVPLPARLGQGTSFTPDGRRMVMVLSDSKSSFGMGEPLCAIVDIEHGREVLPLRGHSQWPIRVRFDHAGRRIVSSAADCDTRQWETFPWREEEYGEEDGGRRTDDRRQRSEVSLSVVAPRPKAESQTSEMTFPERVRAYADRYWRERLRAEATAKPAPPVQPMIRWDRSLWPKRDERAGRSQIDLTEHYTSRLDVCPHPAWFYDHGDNHLGSLPAGTIQLGGVTFDVRGVVFLRRPDISGPPYRLLWEQFPMQVEGIRVGQRVRRLHVLHSIVDRLYAGYAMSQIEQQPDNALVGRYILRYADGAREELPIVVGRHVRHWWAEANEPDPYAALPEGTVVWTGSNPSAKDANATLRLYLTSYENPHPDKGVVSVDFVSAMTTAAPFLVAMTIEP